MKTIRNSLFETNSSSVHSIVVNGQDEYSYKNFDCVNLDEFGWGYGEDNLLKTPDQKLSYLFTYAICRLMEFDDEFSKKEKNIRQTSSFGSYEAEFVRRINEYIHDDNSEFMTYKETQGIDDLVYFVKEHCDDFRNFEIIDYGGYYYIDHQSLECDSLQELLDYNGVSIEELVFNNKYQIEISNDNR